MRKELSVVIPAYNEAPRIAKTLTEVGESLKRAQYQFEILVVNDGSRDETVAEVNKVIQVIPQVRLISLNPNRGKGEAVKEGIKQAKCEYCLFMDADNSTSMKEWPKFEAEFEKGADVVSASRHLPESSIVSPQPFMRRFLGTGYRILCRKIFGLRNSDFNCGFKAFRTSMAQEVYRQATMRDWTFDVEIFCLLKPLKPRLAEVPVEWRHEEKVAGIAPVSTAVRTLGSLVSLKKRF